MTAWIPQLLSCVFLVTFAAAANSTGGYTANIREECINLDKIHLPAGLAALRPYLKRACLTFVLDSCTNQLLFNATWGGEPLLEVNVDSPVYEQCNQPSGLLQCRTCTGGNFTFTPASVTVCPYVREDCRAGITTNNVRANCFTLGSECAGRSCSECVEDPACGWCNAHQLCQPRGTANSPYCSSCTPSSWTTSTAQCNALASGSSSSMSKNTKLALAVIVPVIVLGIALAFCMVKVRRRKGRQAGHELGHFDEYSDTASTIPLQLDGAEDDFNRYDPLPEALVVGKSGSVNSGASSPQQQQAKASTAATAGSSESAGDADSDAVEL